MTDDQQGIDAGLAIEALRQQLSEAQWQLALATAQLRQLQALAAETDA